MSSSFSTGDEGGGAAGPGALTESTQGAASNYSEKHRPQGGGRQQGREPLEPPPGGHRLIPPRQGTPGDGPVPDRAGPSHCATFIATRDTVDGRWYRV